MRMFFCFTWNFAAVIRKTHAKRQEDHMARRKTAAAEAIPTETTEFQAAASDTAVALAEPASAAQRPRQDNFVFKTVNVEGSKIQFQDSRHAGQAWEFQIRFGDGSKDDMPSAAVLEFIKSHKITVETKNGPAEVNLFRWNDGDRAWGMRIPYDSKATEDQNKDAREAARQTAKGVFDGVVEIIRDEQRAARGQTTQEAPDGAVERVRDQRGAAPQL
jgi:hypothetical protein